VRRLIVNADDFGYTPGVNRAIIEAHTHGIVTSSTLMANASAFDDAVRLAKQTPQLSVGCHVVLLDGKPVLDPERVSSLTKNSSTVFRDSPKSFAALAFAGGLDPSQIEAEITAQIRKIQSAGISVSHLDSHKHTHLLPTVLHPMLRAACACGVRAIRNPFGPRKPLKSTELLARPGLWTRYAEVRILRTLAGRFRAAIAKECLTTTDGTIGIVVTGSLDERLFRAIAAAVPEGTWEFVCHPGYNDSDLQRAKTRLRQSRETELRVLTMPEARESLANAGVSLLSYAEYLANG
jgi:hopanoid biosynthesis associated protein HpnK